MVNQNGASQKSLTVFGLVVGPIFTLLSLKPMLIHQELRFWMGALGGTIFFLALVAPKFLRYPYGCWMVLGRQLGRVNSFAILSIVYFVVLLPLSLYFRLKRHNLLLLGFDPYAPTYAQPLIKKERKNFEVQF